MQFEITLFIVLVKLAVCWFSSQCTVVMLINIKGVANRLISFCESNFNFYI